MKYQLFDAHCHLDSSRFDKDREELLILAQRVGVKGIVLAGTTKDSWRKIRQLTALHPSMYTALGLHPYFIDQHTAADIRSLELAVETPPIVAVGEIGLDFYNPALDKNKQVVLFHAQIHIANMAKLPVVLHVRKAHDEVLKHLRISNFQQGGVVHAFNGSMDQAKRYIDMGFVLGFGGAMTYQRATKLRALASTLPLSSIVLETDAPDMKPVTCQLDRNTPIHLLDNFRVLCELRSENHSQVALQTTLNAMRVYRIE